jgi:hypothetical protein
VSAKLVPPKRGLPGLADLQADSQIAFCGLLVWMREGSRLSYGQLAIKTRIARSQVYNLTGPGRPVFPTMRTQVQQLACGCGLGELEVAQLVQLWQTLHDPATPTGRNGSQGWR